MKSGNHVKYSAKNRSDDHSSVLYEGGKIFTTFSIFYILTYKRQKPQNFTPLKTWKFGEREMGKEMEMGNGKGNSGNEEIIEVQTLLAKRKE